MQLTALAQAKLAFVRKVLVLCAQHGCRTFASIVDRDAPRPAGTFLRKDYAFLFGSFYQYMQEQPPHQHGLIVFDEREKIESYLLVEQMDKYFNTARGRLYASRIVPEPFFVHSDLTSMVQVADLVAYIIAWAVRLPHKMTRPGRSEMNDMAKAVCAIRHRAMVEKDGAPFHTWSFSFIDDLRPLAEQETDDDQVA